MSTWIERCSMIAKNLDRWFLRSPLIWLLVFLLVSSPLIAVEPSYESEISNRSEQIQKLLAEKQTTHELLEELRQRELGVVDVLKVLNQNIEASQAKLNRLQLDISQLETDIRITSEKIDGLKLQIEQDQARVDQHLYALFYLKRVRKMTHFLGLDSLKHYFRNQKLLQNFTEIDLIAITRLNDNINELQSEIQRQEQQKNELRVLKQKEEQQQKLIAFERQQQVTYLHHIRKDHSVKVESLRDIQVELERLNDAIHSLETQKRNEEKRKTFRGLNRYKYTLPSPVRGKVVHRFGNKSSQYYTLYKHGVLVDTSEETEVFSILAGQVVWSKPVRGYRNLVILDHGQSSFSVYGNLEEVFVIEGDVVDQNDIVGTVALNPTEDKYLFYFETRHDKKAVNPEQWLKKPLWQ